LEKLAPSIDKEGMGRKRLLIQVSTLAMLVLLVSFTKKQCFANEFPFASEANTPSQYILLNGVAATPEAFREIVSVFGKTTETNVSIGVGFIISYLALTPEEAAVRLRKYLALSEQFDLPVIVQLDGEQWWGKRPDLWNWWDKSKAGYDPRNRKNVEWTGWIADSAVRIGWRNWGRQIRVLPMPNLMSSAYRKACHIEMRKLVPIVMNWWHRLPEDKKYLLVGIKVGWESAIGVNNWYYRDGNDLTDQPVKNDPTYGLTLDSLPGRGVEAIGYAAVRSLGLDSSGKLTQEELTKVVKVHLEDLCRLCAAMGVPRNKLFTHCGGWSRRETLFYAALNRYSCPGWSFYDDAYDPEKAVTAMAALKTSDAPYWGAVEWLYTGQNTEKGWLSALQHTLSIRRIRYLCIYNWGGIRNNHAAIGAIQATCHPD
jgi:hypothetical protein